MYVYKSDIMEKPVGYLLKGEFHSDRKDFNVWMGQPEPQPVYSQEQVKELFDRLSKHKEVPFRRTTIVDWDVISKEFESFGIK